MLERGDCKQSQIAPLNAVIIIIIIIIFITMHKSYMVGRVNLKRKEKQ